MTNNTQIKVVSWEMINFLSGFKELVDVGEFKGKYKVVDTKDYIAVFKTKTEAEQIQELSKRAMITSIHNAKSIANVKTELGQIIKN